MLLQFYSLSPYYEMKIRMQLKTPLSSSPKHLKSLLILHCAGRINQILSLMFIIYMYLPLPAFTT